VNDILLTPEEIETATHSEDEYQLAMQALCRAQLRKVVEWMEKNNTANTVEAYNGWPMQLNEEGMAALKAAGEGK
jgi:hypothetical protein